MFRLLSVLLFTIPAWAQFTPASIDSLLIWYEVDQITTVGTNVNTWTDKANAFDMTIQSTAADTPVVVANYLNGKSAVKFNGASNERYRLGPDSIFYTPSQQGSAFSMAFLVTAGSVDGSMAIFGEKFPNAHFGFYSAPNSRVELQYTKTGPATVVARGSTNLQTDSLYIVIITHGATADSIWLNNVSETISYRAGSFGANLADPAGTDYASLGDSWSGGGRFFDGRLFAFMFFSDPLTPTQRGQVYTYLDEKYVNPPTENRQGKGFPTFPHSPQFPNK